ncbi:hypothetical protein KPH14_007442 [Odynerus spinipes]|uniref:Chitin-binding type-2 domain-containing protein n=1 Tax=Odynerus spinipes TaxID=1348599 RepID=A0AAD9VIQ7_9HYME|nr:hypothetical protein KPH14_007442 [Odynerus spinipes]
MRGSFWLVSAFAAILAAVGADDTTILPVPTECPTVDPTDRTVHLAHESDCTKFYVCFLGEKILKDCPYRNAKGDRLHFNPVLQVCDYPSRAGCKSRAKSAKLLTTLSLEPLTERLTTTSTTLLTTIVTPLTTAAPNVTPSISLSPTPNASTKITYKEHPCACHLYYKNVDGKTILQQCNNGLEWDHERKSCSTPGQKKCMAKSSLLTLLAFPRDLSCEDGEYRPHECTCNLYYKCLGGYLTLRECPDNKHWNQQVHLCTKPEDANCDKQTPEKCVEGSYKPHESECNLYYKCENGKEVLKSCKNGQHWNSVAQICTKPEDANCEKPTPGKCVEGSYKPHDSECNLYYKYANCDLEKPSPTPPTPTPDDRKCVEGSYKPHESKCNLYYKCENGEEALKSCKSGQHWNRVAQICTKPEDANCDLEKPSPTPPTPTPDDRKCVEGSYKPHESKCNLYYKCENGEEALKSCKSGQHWNRIAQICTKPEDALCDLETPSPTPPTPTPDDETCENGTYRPHECQCNFFYECTDNLLILHHCSHGLHWNQEQASYKANCINKEGSTTDTDSENGNSVAQTKVPSTTRLPLTTVPSTATNPTTVPPITTDPTTVYPTTTDVTKISSTVTYSTTVPSTATNPTTVPPITTDPTTVYPTTTDVTKISSTVIYSTTVSSTAADPTTVFSTRDASTIIATSTNLPDITKECPPDNSGTVVHLPHESDCSLYYKCDAGRKVVQSCPPSLHYNSALQVCDWAANANCAYFAKVTENGGKQPEYSSESSDFSSVLPTSVAPSTPGSIATECPPDNSGNAVQLPHETNCSLFYKCDEGKKVVQSCPAGLVFNPVLQVCDFPVNVNCTNKVNAIEAEKLDVMEFVASSSTVPPPTPGVIPTECPPDNSGSAVQLPHETNCSLFYKCDEGKKVVQSCPAGLVFNPVLQVCDFPENVACSNVENFDLIGFDTDEMEGSTESPASCIGTCPPVDPHNYTVLLPNTDCTKYCKCSNGQAIVRKCPVGLHFDPVEKVCNYPYIAKCDVVLAVLF